MQRLFKNSVILLAAVILILSACRKPVDFPDIPAITFESFEIYQDSAFVSINFQDGDGNIGLNAEDDEGDFALIYQPEYNIFHHNFFLDFYLWENNEWVWQDYIPEDENDPTSPYYYRIPPLDPEGKDKNLEGTIRVKLSPFPPIDFSSEDRIRIEVQLADRSLNLSNLVTTPEYTIP